MPAIHLVFVHGWSVTNLNTYGQLPVRLKSACATAGIDITVQEIWLGRYISFHDEVRLPDIARAFQAAVTEQLAPLFTGGGKFVCITHSTGGPVLRDWWARYYQGKDAPCPLSHLVMLAPANFGSALAQLGKAKIGRLASWLEGVEPGQGVLDWLELGSMEAWELNRSWITTARPKMDDNGFYPFVLIGQSIDRKLYDNLNSYTGELGSDGVVRSAAANLNASLITIRQAQPVWTDGTWQQADAQVSYTAAPTTALRVLTGKSHSGPRKGIMASVQDDPSDTASQETLDAIIRCIEVGDGAAYDQVCGDFAKATDAVQQAERLEIVEDSFVTLTKRYFIHDRFCMIIFRVTDTDGYAVTDYDLLLTAGPAASVNHLPPGFFADRQQNSLHPETVTYFINYDILNGSAAVQDGTKIIRAATDGIDELGLQVIPRPDNGFVRYLSLEVIADKDFFTRSVKPNATILIDICLQRMVSTEVFRQEGPVTAMPDDKSGDFKGTDPGTLLIP